MKRRIVATEDGLLMKPSTLTTIVDRTNIRDRFAENGIHDISITTKTHYLGLFGISNEIAHITDELCYIMFGTFGKPNSLDRYSLFY